MSDPVALVLAGGGARAAYQTGVSQALYTIFSEVGLNFPSIFCGTSAGAINSAFLACGSHMPLITTKELCNTWGNLRPDRVFNTKALKLSAIGTKWMTGFMVGGLLKDGNPVNSLLDASPLRELIGRHFSTKRLQKNIDDHHLQGLSISTTNYYSGSNVIFFQGQPQIQPWTRSDRLGVRESINIDHIMASAAIPFFFPPVRLAKSFYGDGSLRQMAPLSPAVHLGAKKIIAVGMRYGRNSEQAQQLNQQDHNHSPHIAQIAGSLLNSIFLDSLEYDMERLERLNQLHQKLDENDVADNFTSIRSIPVLLLRPSQDLAAMAYSFLKDLPPILRFLLKSLGVSQEDGADLLSYLAFDQCYTRPLIRLGQQDTMEQKDRIIHFLTQQ